MQSADLASHLPNENLALIMFLPEQSEIWPFCNVL